MRQIIENTCDNVDARNPGFAGKLGKGRVNAHRALASVPVPAIDFQMLRSFPFPQLNQGSSTGLSYRATPACGRRLPIRADVPDAKGGRRADLLLESADGRRIRQHHACRQHHDRQPGVGWNRHPRG